MNIYFQNSISSTHFSMKFTPAYNSAGVTLFPKIHKKVS